MPEIEASQLDRQCLEALKSIGKTLGQMTLYKVGHPAVAATIQIAEGHLGQALTQAPKGEIVFSIDQDKLLANGRIIGSVGQLPSSVAVLFNRFKLTSLTFKSGVSNPELAAFCELAASRPDAAPAADPKGYLSDRGVSHILLNEAVYAKLGEAPAPGGAEAPAVETSAPDAAAKTPEAIEKAIVRRSIEDTIQALIIKAVPDPALRRKIFEQVMEILKRDIEKRVEEAVRPVRQEKNIIQNEQARTQTVLSTMAEGVIVVDEQGKILMMNPAAEQIYGTTLAQVAGKHLTEKAGEEHVVTLAAEIATPPPEGTVSREVKVAAADDTRRTVMKAGAVVQNEAGKVVGMVSSLTDVAKYKELQRMQRDFVSHVTHELRAPLSSIRAALEIVQGQLAGKVKEDENRMLSTALRNSDRLAELINGILDFSKIESGQMTVFPKKSDAETIAREAVDSLSPWATKKGIALALEAAPELPPVSADPGRVVQVIVNLISNAIKFTPAGGRITVRAAMSPPAAKSSLEKSVQFSVTDTGSGIPKSQQERIFEKFVQIASGEMHVGGTGLGLAIAKALVHLHKGRMWVESEEGRGATFLFTLPLYTGSSGETPVPQPRAEAVATPWWKKLLGSK